MFRRATIPGLLLALLPAIAGANTYLLVPGVNGNVTEAAHRGWIEVLAVDWAVNAASTWTSAGGASIAKPSAEPLKLVLQGGPWSATFLRTMASGKTFTQVTIDNTSPDGRPIYRLRFDGLIVTKVHFNSGQDPGQMDEIEVVYRNVRAEYYSIDATGRVTTTAVEWNLATGIVN